MAAVQPPALWGKTVWYIFWPLEAIKSHIFDFNWGKLQLLVLIRSWNKMEEKHSEKCQNTPKVPAHYCKSFTWTNADTEEEISKKEKSWVFMTLHLFLDESFFLFSSLGGSAASWEFNWPAELQISPCGRTFSCRFNDFPRRFRWCWILISILTFFFPRLRHFESAEQSTQMCLH